MMDENKGLLNSRHRESEDLVPAHRQRQHWACCSDCPSPSLGNQSRYPTSSFFSVTYLVTLHLLCLLLSAYLLSTWIRLSERQASPLLDFDTRYPDWVPISYELQHEDVLARHTNKYTGLPNEANTKAWDDLIIPTFFSASLEDLQKTGESVNDSVRLAQGGYIAGLGVYHHVHCLRRFRIFLHSDYYYGNLTEANMEYLRGHLGHCIESLRRSILCNADTTVYTFTWTDAEFVRPGIWRPKPKTNQERKCVKWEAVEAWARERHVALNPVLLKSSGEEEKVLMI